MKLDKILYIFFFLIFSVQDLRSDIIYPLASVNNKIITNYDLYLETKIFEVINNKTIPENEKRSTLEKLINQTVKKLEADKFNISIDNEITMATYNNITNKKDLPLELERKLKEKLSTENRWEKLIFLKFKSKLALNINEINKKYNLSNASKDEKDKIMLLEKSKKLNNIGLSYFNEIKKKYYIKKY